jgi:hypothetical protein
MAKKQLGAGNRYAEFRSGLGGFIWEGIATKVDPGASPPNRPRILENVRIQGGSIISRPDFDGPGAVVPPITAYNFNSVDGTNTPLNSKNRLGYAITGVDNSWTPHWAAEFNSVGGTRLWWGSTPPLSYVPLTDTWEIVETGGMYGFVDTDCDPILNTAGIYFSADSWPPCIEKYATEVYIGDFGALRKVHMVQPPAGYAPADVLSTPGDTIVLEYPGFRTAAMTEYQGKLWIVIVDPTDTVNAHVYSYDGYVAVDEKTFTSSGATGAAIATFKNQLVVTLQGTGELYVREADGTWSTIVEAGFDSSPFLNSMAQYRDQLVICDGVDTLWGWDGTDLTALHTITMAAPGVPAYLYCCAVMNDVLYYGWTDSYHVPPAYAVATLTYTGDPSDGDTLTLGAKTYRFKTVMSQAYDVQIYPGNADATYTALKQAIVGGLGYPYNHMVITANGNTEWTPVQNTGANTLTLTAKNAGVAYNFPAYTMVEAINNATLVQPAGGVNEVRQHVKLGKYDNDNDAATKFIDEWTKWGTLMVPNNLGVSLANHDWCVGAMAFYRGRLWLAVTGLPGGNSHIMTHSIQYAPYDGWFICDTGAYTEAYANQVGYGNDPLYGHGPGHSAGYDFYAGTCPQIYYLRSI